MVMDIEGLRALRKRVDIIEQDPMWANHSEISKGTLRSISVRLGELIEIGDRVDHTHDLILIINRLAYRLKRTETNPVHQAGNDEIVRKAMDYLRKHGFSRLLRSDAEDPIGSLKVSSYILQDKRHRLELLNQKNGSEKWAIRDNWECCMNKDGEWENEPMPSNCDDDFFKRCRFDTVEEALTVYNSHKDDQ